MEIRFDDVRHVASNPQKSYVFRKPIHIIEATAPEQVGQAFKQVDDARRAGHWLAGYATYELGFVLEPALIKYLPQLRTQPFLRFGVFDAPESAIVPPGKAAFLGDLAPVTDRTAYRHMFEQVRDHIARGDIYQANLTFPIRATLVGRAADLYGTLLMNQPVGHAAFVDQGRSAPTFVCCSPELFFATDKDGQITTRPMKGTMPRGATAAEDAANRAFLRADEKNLAENTMIVDLLRNDLSRIARIGTVHVPRLHEIEAYASVFQMTSTVSARLAEGIELSDIFRALFPCGSITGAPKIRAMQILRDLEPEPRGIYCGTVGWAAPDGSSCFNVAIRTVILDGKTATLNVGGGLVWDSTCDAEYDEALWKSRFAKLSRKARC